MKKNTNQIAVDRDDLMAALNAASQCLSAKQVSPILGNFLMTFKDGTLDISATDLDGAVRAAIPIA